MNKKQSIVSTLLIALLAGPAAPQQQTTAPPEAAVAKGGITKFSTTRELVVVDLTAKDKDGKPVKGLKASDFVLTEDGKKQDISIFEYQELEEAVRKCKLTEIAERPNAAATAICGKVEAELSEMSDADAAEFLSSYGLRESGLTRLIRTTYKLLGLISFFTAGEDECRAWQIPAHTRAQEAAGAEL